MHVTGVIVEYNPMHNGHLYHVEQSRLQTGADAVVAVMSGHFLQRGEPAIVNKWARARMALQQGVDLVVELPVAYSTQSAMLFAYGSVAVLDRLGAVDSLCFGSESGDIKSLQTLSSIIVDEPPLLQSYIQLELQKGVSYPRATGAALVRYAEQDPHLDERVVGQPNNMLGLEYLAALRRLNSSITPATITRIAAGYNEERITHPKIASATAIRKATLESGVETAAPLLPELSYSILREEFAAGRGPMRWENYRQTLFTLLHRATPEQLARFVGVDEGLEARLIEAARRVDTVQDLIAHAKTKRFTWTKIQRALTSILLGVTREEQASLLVENGPDYIRVLGFTERGRDVLRRASERSVVPILTKMPRQQSPMLQLDLRASRIYSQGYTVPQSGAALWDFTTPVIRL
ncbi:nucleotidyltransferase [Tumebacillus permanentifrigoris]|uniref:tRNA(Met) cytidine acetate ligase n=1 Tax=Tumebacillus permanentifrigoris TaxID=378543 RepID=A0A316D7X9_9BACL|nr:nucleotidyltransferase [Tumebacillus permanentifrigoris]PWK12776.1 putative nucleotidyltransferase [Tumebacillus permanentifrigoris]